MTRNLKRDAHSHPVRAMALEKLVRDTPLTYEPQVLEVVNVGYNGCGDSRGHKECTKDGEMAFSAALLYWATRNRNYASLSMKILKAWATTNKSFQGDNALLEASWSVCSMARAAELLKHADDKSVAKEWLQIEACFFTWLDDVIMKVLRSTYIWRWKVTGNWHFSNICARMQLAILREDQEEWKWCIETYPNALPAAVLNDKCLGETAETCRDTCHAQFLLGGLIQVPEMAYHQGVTLYKRDLVPCFELQAAIMLREVPEGLRKEDIRTFNNYYHEPVFEIALVHFQDRRKIPMPKVTAFLNRPGVRPERVTFHWGAGTLTHYLRCK